MSAVIYTALYGDYDTLKPLCAQGCDAIAFTDKPMQAEGWQVKVIPRPEPHPRMQAKYFKLNPHECLPEYDVSVWIDASVFVMNPNFVNEIVACLADAPLGFFPHRWRTNVSDELAEHLKLPKYAGLPLEAQVEHYKAQGFPDNIGLMECTVLTRKHNDTDAVKFDTAWWQENVKWSYADQLSAPFVAWKEQTPFAWLPYTIGTQAWFRITSWKADY